MDESRSWKVPEGSMSSGTFCFDWVLVTTGCFVCSCTPPTLPDATRCLGHSWSSWSPPSWAILRLWVLLPGLSCLLFLLLLRLSCPSIFPRPIDCSTMVRRCLVSARHAGESNVMAAARACALDYSPPKLTVVIDKATHAGAGGAKRGVRDSKRCLRVRRRGWCTMWERTVP